MTAAQRQLTAEEFLRSIGAAGAETYPFVCGYDNVTHLAVELHLPNC